MSSSKDLDLTNQQEVKHFFEKEKPEIVINAAAKVGGIWANNEYGMNLNHHHSLTLLSTHQGRKRVLPVPLRKKGIKS